MTLVLGVVSGCGGNPPPPGDTTPTPPPVVSTSYGLDFGRNAIKSNNTNLQSLGTSYYNVNGTTVSVDALYRLSNTVYDDPNTSFGLLVYQCWQYKLAYPEEDVELAFSTYRFSVTAAVCVDPESEYYGQGRSIYNCDIDEDGFITIAHMLVECAKIGIKVTLVGQLDSYAVKQYNEEGKLVKVPEPSYKPYFREAMLEDCYPEFEEGKKVADFMVFSPVQWTLSDKGSVDMMHLKACTVSHYLTTSGEKKTMGVWFSSTNLDAVDYRGYNANNGGQSGAIVTGHEMIYTVTLNYIKLIAEHDEQEAVYELRDIVRKRTTEQAALILDNKSHLIPKEEQLIYLGSPTDTVFELYFAPLEGMVDVWNETTNPYCKYVAKMARSTDYIELSWNAPTYDNSFYVSNALYELVNKAFTENRNIKNRISIHLKGYDFSVLDTLEEGKDLEYKHLRNSKLDVHAKDVLLSYEENDVRHYVSLLSSCNFHMGALYYQANYMLVINETDATGNALYRNIGKKCSYGAIRDKGDGLSPTSNTVYEIEHSLDAMPNTFESVVCIPADSTEYVGSIMSNDDANNKSVSYSVNAEGNVVVGIRVLNNNIAYYTFDEVDLRTGSKTHLAVTYNSTKNHLSCYVNGELIQTIKSVIVEADFVPKQNFVVGGDWSSLNHNYFHGTIYGVALWKDSRSSQEIKNDYENSLDCLDSNMIFAYDLTRPKNELMFDLCGKGIPLTCFDN